jgi:hypothetical protein
MCATKAEDSKQAKFKGRAGPAGLAVGRESHRRRNHQASIKVSPSSITSSAIASSADRAFGRYTAHLH